MIFDDVLPKISWLKGSKKAQNGQKNLNWFFLLKHRFYDVFRCFFQSLTTFFDVFFRCNHRNNFFTTISDGCNSRCKRSSSTILRPGCSALTRVLQSVCAFGFCSRIVIEQWIHSVEKNNERGAYSPWDFQFCLFKYNFAAVLQNIQTH